MINVYLYLCSELTTSYTHDDGEMPSTSTTHERSHSSSSSSTSMIDIAMQSTSSNTQHDCCSMALLSPVDDSFVSCDATPNDELVKWIGDYHVSCCFLFLTCFFLQNFTPCERIDALTLLVSSISIGDVRHLSETIEPYFKKDFIRMLPKEVCCLFWQLCLFIFVFSFRFPSKYCPTLAPQICAHVHVCLVCGAQYPKIT
jgi:hypothetical protein